MILKIFLTISLIFSLSYSDDISYGYHWIDRDVYITNSDEYQDITIVACVDVIMGTSGCYKVMSNEALSTGYYHNKLRLMAVKTTLLDSNGGLVATNIDSVVVNELSEKLLALSKDINAPEFYYSARSSVEDTYADMISEKYYHEIYLDENNTTHIKLKRRVVGFSDSTEETINYH